MSAKVRFRSGWTCSCVAESLPLVEEELLLRGYIHSSVTIYQLGWRNDVGASAGTHSKGGCTDVGEYSDTEIDIWRLWGWTMQHRTPAQGFSHHAHGWPWGCPHMSAAGNSQATQWRNRQNGLVSRGRVQGRWPIDTWTTARDKRKKVLVALKDDIASAVVAKLKGEYDDIAKAVWAADVIPNNFSGNTKNKTVPASFAVEVLGSRTRDLAKTVWNYDAVPNTYNPADPNDKMAPLSALKVLMDRQRRQGGDTDLADQLAAILAALTKENPAA